MHILIACLCVAVLALLVSVSVLWRRVQTDRRIADGRADVAEGYRIAALIRLGKLESARACRRVHAADLPPGWVQAPISVRGRVPVDEDEVNPTLRSRV